MITPSTARGLLALGVLLLQTTVFVAGLGGAAPLRVGLVRWHDLPQAGGASTLQRSAASALRAAGYPAVPQLSKAPFQRAADVLATDQQRGINAFGLATPIPLGFGGPSLASNIIISSSSHSQRKLQQSSGIQPVGGFEGTSSATPAGTSALAAGPHHLLQAAGGLVTIYNLTSSSSSSSKAGSSIQVLQTMKQSVELSSLMSAASSGCDGVFDPSAVYDAAAHRFLVSATCGGQGLLLLAVSATSDAAGAWFVSALVADGVGTSLACTSPAVESALVDYTQLSYNADGVYVTYKSICPSNATNSGVGLLALPKWALYRGVPSFQYPIYSGSELAAALQSAQNSSSSSSSGADGSSSSSSSSSRCTQLMPVVPQEAHDVGLGTVQFVCELVNHSTAAHATGRSVGVFALVDTASLWQYGGPATNTSAPLLVGQAVQLDAPAPPITGLPLRQPQGAQPLQLGTRPRGLWNGAAVLSGGQLYLATSTLVSDKVSPSYSRRPAIAWAQLSVSAATQGTDTCSQSRAGVTSRQAWDWAKDYSKEWGPQAAAALAAASATGSNSSDRQVHAAGKLLGALGAAQFAAVGLMQLGANPCTCYSCYWGGQYNRYGGYNGGALAGTGSGFASSGYFFQQNSMSRCQSFCTRCWYYGYPGHGFGNVGDDKTFMDVSAAFPAAANASGATPAEGGPTLSINTAAQAQASSLFAPCSRSGSLQAQVLRQGVVSKGGAQPLGLVFPALAVGRTGELLLTFSYAGPGDVNAGTPAFLGVGATVVQAGSNSSSVLVLQPGRGTVKPAALAGGAVPPSGGWAELSAAAVQSGTGALFTSTHFASALAAETSTVGSWINAWHL